MKIIGIYTRNGMADYPEDLLQLIQHIRQSGFTPALHQYLAGQIRKKTGESVLEDAILFKGYKDLPPDMKLLISYGGDGTMLRAATLVRDSGVPILGVNAGRLGFLAHVPRQEAMQALDKFISGKYDIEARSLLTVDTFPQKTKIAGLNFALNEVTVTRKNTTSMIKVEAYVNDEFLSHYWADGLIVSTPTGSTGYSLSCGGPILMPGSGNFVLTAIAPHNLTVRPLVIPDDSVVKLIPHGREKEFLLSMDSRVFSLPSGTEIIVKKASFKLNLVRIEPYTFIRVLRQKLFWGFDNRNQ